MEKRLSRVPSPSFVISLIALFVALGGTTYAATTLPKNSVGTKQLKKNAVTSPKIGKGAVTAAKINTKGLTVPSAVNATSAASATHATTADTATNAGSLGSHPASYFAAATLPAGQSESGVFALGGPSPGSNYGYASSVTFPTPLAHALDSSHVVAVPQGAAPQPHCSGQGQADPGYLCVYSEISIFMTVPSNGIGAPDSQQVGSGAQGFIVFGTTNATTGAASVYGTWTVTG